MRMEQLQYFLATARAGSINQAAKALFISQPALNETLRNLEKELDCTLLIRSKKGAALTEDGQILAEYAAEILQSYDQLLSRLRDKHQAQALSQPHGVLQLVATPVFAATYLHRILKQFQQQYPAITVKYLEREAGERFWACFAANPELLGLAALYQLPEPESGLGICAYLEEIPLVACVNRASPLAFKTAMPFAEVDKLPLITFESPFAEEDFRINDAMVITNAIEMHIYGILEQNGVSVVPQSTYARHFAAEEITALPIVPAQMVTSCILCRTTKTLSAIEKLFIDFVRAHCASAD